MLGCEQAQAAAELERFAVVCTEPIGDAMPRKVSVAMGAVLIAQAEILRIMSRCPEVCAVVDLSALRAAINEVEELLRPTCGARG